jgi:hypothetical protein
MNEARMGIVSKLLSRSSRPQKEGELDEYPGGFHSVDATQRRVRAMTGGPNVKAAWGVEDVNPLADLLLELYENEVAAHLLGYAVGSREAPSTKAEGGKEAVKDST